MVNIDPDAEPQPLRAGVVPTIARDGIINLDKPVGITSARALYRLRKLTGLRKSGHAGTLDPLAEGVLLICCGRATKLVERLMALPKVYRTTARLDVTSSSFDSERPLEPVACDRIPGRDDVAHALESFLGVTEQTPPATSAVKIDGRPAYKFAHRGKTPELKSRPVTIYWFRVHAFDWPTIDFEMCCGRGTYVRALIRDLGVRLATGGCLTSLARTRIGPFCRTDAIGFEPLQPGGGDLLIPLERVEALLAEAAGQVPAPDA